MRSQVGTHAGFIQQLLQPYHTTIDLDSIEELSNEILSRKLQSLIGTSAGVVLSSVGHKEVGGVGSASVARVGPAVVVSASQKSNLIFEDEAAFKQVLAQFLIRDFL